MNLPGLIAAVFPSVSDAPIRLQGKAIDHIFESPGEILSSIKNFYVNETLKQVYKIIGSLDFVGNPTIIFSSFVSGVRDLVVAPTSAFLKSPTNVNQVGIGVAKGTLSLFSHSASGIFGFLAKMSATAGQAAAILSLDNEFRKWHRDNVMTEASNLNRVWKRRGVQSVSDMIARPVWDIVSGFGMGISGIFISPYKGLRKRGGIGFVKGVAVGTAGVVAKPLVGFFDAFTHFSSTAYDVARSVNVLERRFQPALKIRLPYVFGPMNILAPFDRVAARSVYILKIFPPRTKKRKKKRKDKNRWKEIHVASEVLNMEPGVETYAIVTTLRVILVKIKKENTGVLSPAFCWEVDLSGQSTVNSRVSDHGHNGVALTITKRARTDKKKTEVLFMPTMDTKSTNDEEGGTNSIAKTHSGDDSRITSQDKREQDLSDSSGSEDDNLDEEDVDVDEHHEIVPETDVPDEDSEADLDPAAEDEESVGKNGSTNEDETETAYHDHGATKEDGQLLEWFTVLAEYQHRRQLTNIHNAISCIVGDFDSIIADQLRIHHHETEGTTSFGIFTFDSTDAENKALQASSPDLLLSLEKLPWVHEKFFREYKNKPKQRQRDALARSRNMWVFSRDLEASMAIGGPAWLVEARARAMFVPPEPPELPNFLEAEDNVVKEVLLQLEQGNISLGQAHELLGTGNMSILNEGSSTAFGASSGSERTMEEDYIVGANEISPYLDNRREASESTDHSNFVSLDRSDVSNQEDFAGRMDDELQSGISTNSYSHGVGDEPFESINSKSEPPVDFVGQSSLANTEAKSLVVGDTPQQTMNAPSYHPRNSEGQNRRSESYKFYDPQSSHVDETAIADSTSQHVSISRDVPGPDPVNTRMDKLESLLEQLVILNASQAQRQMVTTEVKVPAPTSEDTEGEAQAAESLRTELEDLRAEVASRKKEDDELRNEIAALREQLAQRKAETPLPAEKEKSEQQPKQKGKKEKKESHLFRQVLKLGSGKQTNKTSKQHAPPPRIEEIPTGFQTPGEGMPRRSSMASRLSETETSASGRSSSKKIPDSVLKTNRRYSNEGDRSQEKASRATPKDTLEAQLDRVQKQNDADGLVRQEKIIQRRASLGKP